MYLDKTLLYIKVGLELKTHPMWHTHVHNWGKFATKCDPSWSQRDKCLLRATEVYFPKGAEVVGAKVLCSR